MSEIRLANYPVGRFCPDCGKAHVECRCDLRPPNPAPRFAVGDVVYRRHQTQEAMTVLHRELIAHVEPYCSDDYDGHHAGYSYPREWRYEVHWVHMTCFAESDLCDRAEALNYHTWYWWWCNGDNHAATVFEVRKEIKDATEAEILPLIERLKRAKAGKLEALRIEKELGVQIDLRKEGFM